MPKRKLEDGEIRSTKEQKREITWIGWDIMRLIISFIVFAAERPIPRLDLVCRTFKRFFEEEMESYFKTLVKKTPGIVSIFSTIEIVNTNFEIGAKERCHIYDPSCGLFKIGIGIFRVLCKSSIGKSPRFPEEIIALDPYAKIPHDNEEMAVFDDSCDFVWNIDKIPCNFENTTVSLVWLSEEKNASINRELLDFVGYKQHSIAPGYEWSIFSLAQWYAQPKLWKKSQKAIHKWENKLGVNSLVKSITEQSNFKLDNYASRIRHRIRQARTHKDSAALLTVLSEWTTIMTENGLKSRVECKNLYNVASKLLGPRFWATSGSPMEWWEQGREIDLSARFSKKDCQISEDIAESIQILENTIKEMWNDIFSTYEHYRCVMNQ